MHNSAATVCHNNAATSSDSYSWAGESIRRRLQKWNPLALLEKQTEMAETLLCYYIAWAHARGQVQ